MAFNQKAIVAVARINQLVCGIRYVFSQQRLFGICIQLVVFKTYDECGLLDALQC